MLFRLRAIVEALTQSHTVVEVEICTAAGVQLARRVMLVEIDDPVVDATPQTSAKDVVQGAPATVHVDLLGFKQATVCRRRS